MATAKEILAVARKELGYTEAPAGSNKTKAALQTVYDALNQGQRKQIVKDEAVKALFDLYGVEYS